MIIIRRRHHHHHNHHHHHHHHLGLARSLHWDLILLGVPSNERAVVKDLSPAAASRPLRSLFLPAAASRPLRSLFLYQIRIAVPLYNRTAMCKLTLQKSFDYMRAAELVMSYRYFDRKLSRGGDLNPSPLVDNLTAAKRAITTKPLRPSCSNLLVLFHHILPAFTQCSLTCSVFL